MKNIFGWLIAACLLAACGSPDEGPEIRNFDALTKKETDAAFSLSATSKSPAPFKYESSNTAVASIDGALVTIKGAGQTTLTASQARSGSFGPTEKTALLTVTAVACDSGQVRIAGKCEAVPSCVSPATLNAATNRCVAPASSASPVTLGARIYMGVTTSYKWADASAFCTSIIDNQSGWRLPTPQELTDLHASGLSAGRNWLLGPTWTSAMAANLAESGHVAVDLSTGKTLERADGAGTYATCVR